MGQMLVQVISETLKICKRLLHAECTDDYNKFERQKPCQDCFMFFIDTNQWMEPNFCDNGSTPYVSKMHSDESAELTEVAKILEDVFEVSYFRYHCSDMCASLLLLKHEIAFTQILNTVGMCFRFKAQHFKSERLCTMYVIYLQSVEHGWQLQV